LIAAGQQETGREHRWRTIGRRIVATRRRLWVLKNCEPEILETWRARPRRSDRGAGGPARGGPRIAGSQDARFSVSRRPRPLHGQHPRRARCPAPAARRRGGPAPLSRRPNGWPRPRG